MYVGVDPGCSANVTTPPDLGVPPLEPEPDPLPPEQAASVSAARPAATPIIWRLFILTPVPPAGPPVGWHRCRSVLDRGRRAELSAGPRRRGRAAGAGPCSLLRR